MGAVLVDKPVGPTSHDVVRQVRRAVGAETAGHTGTLDPFASGLMVVLLGRATRLAQFVESDRKTYLAAARLGFSTTTDDATGEMQGEVRATEHLSAAMIDRAMRPLRGAIEQLPPAYSAKKVAGKRAYAMARQGIEVALPPVQVTVHELELVDWQAPVLEFRCSVSAGTYVRALGRDIGEALGCGAHLTALRRESIGALQVQDAVPLADVTSEAPLLTPVQLLAHLPTFVVPDERRAGLLHGQSLPPEDALHGAVLLIDEAGQLLAVGHADERRVHPGVVLATGKDVA